MQTLGALENTYVSWSLASFLTVCHGLTRLVDSILDIARFNIQPFVETSDASMVYMQTGRHAVGLFTW